MRVIHLRHSEVFPRSGAEDGTNPSFLAQAANLTNGAKRSVTKAKAPARKFKGKARARSTATPGPGSGQDALHRSLDIDALLAQHQSQEKDEDEVEVKAEEDLEEDDEVQIVETRTSSAEDKRRASIRAGKKRARSPSPDVEIMPKNKKAKFTQPPHDGAVEDKDSQADEDEQQEQEQTFPLAQYVIDFQYIAVGPDALAQAAHVADLVQAQGSTSSLEAVKHLSVTDTHICSVGGQLDVRMGTPRVHKLKACPDTPLLGFPIRLVNEHPAQYTLRSILDDCLLLTEDDRIRMEHSLHILAPTTPAGNATEDDDIEIEMDKRDTIHLRLTLSLSAIFPQISSTPQRKTASVASRAFAAQRRLLTHFFSRSEGHSGRNDATVPATFDGQLDIPFLYSLLSAAPIPTLTTHASISESGVEPDPVDVLDALQPPELLPTLLPFQRRSVYWLLSREHKTISAMGQVVPLPTSSPLSWSSSSYMDTSLPLFWTRHSQGSDSTILHSSESKIPTTPIVYFNPLTAQLLPASSLPPPHPMGGILAEEPGLGKTVEMLALLLLNPAPSTRGPHNTRWDPEARMSVREVRTTLIVTPPALAPQWADEIKKHAPSLRVFVYEGWHRLRVPVSGADVDAAKESRKMQKMKEGVRLKKEMRKERKGREDKLWKEINEMTRKEECEVGDEVYESMMSRMGYWEKLQALDDEEMEEEEKKKSGASGSRTRGAKSKGKGKGKSKAEDEDIEDDDEDEELLEWTEYINKFDVCITTYNVLQQDLAVAVAPVERPRRTVAAYVESEDKPRSPLIMCEWYRVIMDEVQMVGSGKTEEMVSLIPRLSSFAVSGTPARAQVADLYHVVKFLRVAGAEEPGHWKWLLQPENVDLFAALFQSYAIRTLKSSVRDELTIPTQTRYLVPIDLGRVERQVYDQAFERALEELGLDARGVAASTGWALDAGVLRSWVRKLRGITTHPQVGALENRTERLLAKAGALKSIGEVLEDMCAANHRAVLDHRKAKAELLTNEARLRQNNQISGSRYQDAVRLLRLADAEIGTLVNDVRADIVAHEQKGEALRQEVINQTKKQWQEAKEREKEGGRSGETSKTEEDAIEDALAASLRTPAGETHTKTKGALGNRLRDCQLLAHKIKFFMGDVYHILDPGSPEEAKAYQAADDIRSVILAAPASAAQKLMDQLIKDKSVGSKGINQQALHIETPIHDRWAKRSEVLMMEVNDTLSEILNVQGALLWDWRSQLVDELAKPLLEKDAIEELREAEAEGDQQDAYSRTLEAQARAEVMLSAYASVLADRREILVGQRSALATHDYKPLKKRRKNKAQKDDGDANPDNIIANMELDARPEDEVFAASLRVQREAVFHKYREEDVKDGRPLRKLFNELGTIAADLGQKNPEREVVNAEILALRQIMNKQNDIIDKLEVDLAHMRKAFNERIEYFRQLQDISDSVAEVEWEGSLVDAIRISETERLAVEGKITTGIGRARYLENLTEDKVATNGAENPDDDDKDCIICREEFHRGYMTPCAHVICEGCMKAWLTRGGGSKTCPICRSPILAEELRRFTVGTTPAPAVGGNKTTADGNIVPRSLRKVDYNFLPQSRRSEIDQLECSGSYGSKIESIIRHLLQIQAKEPGAKSILFSAWPDSLAIIQHALTRNDIPCLRIDQTSSKQSIAQRFQSDPTMLVLLLHGQRDNAGLNVTCASRVFLVESVVNHAFELQAIARVDRMGQTRPTEVFCYYAEDTLERNILDLAARQGLSLYTKETCSGTVSVETFADSAGVIPAEPAPKARKIQQKGDYVMSTDDMLAILFPTMYEDIEYLIPNSDNAMDADRIQEDDRPEAGPSSLRRSP